MVRFYDPIDRSEQLHIERLLRSGGVEYFLQERPDARLETSQILVAEEDLPEAERLLAGTRH